MGDAAAARRSCPRTARRSGKGTRAGAAALGFGLALSGCAGLTGPYGGPEPAGPAFDPRAARFILRHGPNVIEGDARAGAASCAGDEASLAPDTAYTRARLDLLYGGPGVARASIERAPRLPRDPQYQYYVLHAACDEAGHFRFGGLADGRYVLIAALHLPGQGPGQGLRQGVSVRRTVYVHGGQTRLIHLG
jgi:hypothetical protein